MHRRQKPWAEVSPLRNAIHLVIIGTPKTQGSKSAVVIGGRARILEGKGKGRTEHKAWRDAVASEARAWQLEHGDGLLTGPVVVRMMFGLQKPTSAPKTKRTWPIKARSGDIDKLQRSVLDSLTGTILADDSQVVAVRAEKDWSDPPGVVICIHEVEADWTHVPREIPPAPPPHVMLAERTAS